MKNQVNKVTTNILGSIAGAALGYYAAKKFNMTSNKLALAAIIVVGVMVGANTQSIVAAKIGSAKSGEAAKV